MGNWTSSRITRLRREKSGCSVSPSGDQAKVRANCAEGYHERKEYAGGRDRH